MKTETMTLYKGKKEALVTTRLGHVEKEYGIMSDTISEDGTRTIVIKPKDLSEFNQMRKEIVNAIAEKLGESESKTLKAILLDTLRDYSVATIRRLHNKTVKGIVSVKATRGCFEIIVGDGRRKSAEIIRIRD